MSNNADDKLLQLASKLKAEKQIETPIETTVEEEYETTLEDIQDIVQKSFDRVLTTNDYLMLVALDSKSLEAVAVEFDVTPNYIKKLMRSNTGSEFLKDQAKQKSEYALSIATTTVAEGILHYQAMVNNLFKQGKTELALSYLFGKASLHETQQALHKQLTNQVEESDDGLKSLFSSLLVDKVGNKENG